MEEKNDKKELQMGAMTVIAKKAGVSNSSVAKYIQGGYNMSFSVTTRIEKAMKDLGLDPAEYARDKSVA